MALVVVARFDDLPTARLAEGFLSSAGLSAHLSDYGLASIDPLMMRALGGLRLAVPEQEAQDALKLLARANAGEFAEQVDGPDAIEDRRPLPWPVAVVTVLATGGAIGYAATKRSVRNWIDAVGLAVVLALAAGAIAFLLWGLADWAMWLLSPAP
ncbi:hypothetical protein [Brevundimonas sp.]|uniref:hypothetical protein n=1 Tax=Brevundimonas sp. TaxID=1871086 RepID=UPI0025F699AE|nr:hypothetical protein [Brevundimonas sp.]